MSEKRNEEVSFLECEKHGTFWMLIFVAGFYGAYTYSVRGGVFCNAQTANVVLFAMALGNRNMERVLYLLIPISAYFLGAIVSEILAKKVKEYHMLRWDTILVGFEIVMVLILGALPVSAPDQICQVALNFICSMQFNTFRQNEGIPMATIFVTNHIRQTGSNLVKAVRDGDKKAGRVATGHFIMLFLFFAGGVLSTVLCHFFGVRAIWGAAVFLAILFIHLLIADRTYEKNMLSRVPKGH
ncbi:Uncharacterized membrane protein YoaK, UPF0700 family [Lachnospiraceae bacterium]|nr:Uncharacterized membrane protein YoaK, UPF0700 family [Lachnospiraceae bacterium]